MKAPVGGPIRDGRNQQPHERNRRGTRAALGRATPDAACPGDAVEHARRRRRDRRSHHHRAQDLDRLPQLSDLPPARRWDHAVADDVPRRPDRVQVRDARGVGHPGRRGDHRLCGELGRDVLRARRPPRRAGMADRRDRRDRRVAPGRAAESGRQGDRRHRALEPRDRSVRRGGPACARGACLARRGRLREREPAPEGTRGREDLVRTARALPGAQWGRRRLQRPRPRRDRGPVDHRWLGRRGVPPRPEDRRLRPGASTRSAGRADGDHPADPGRDREPVPRARSRSRS